MNLLFFIRLLLRHILLLITLPIILAFMVMHLTKDQPKIYVSSTRLYTGITTGSSIASLESSKVDLFATRTAFDNLINIINARSTMEEVSLRLLAIHLMLDEPRTDIISKKSFDNLQVIVPEKVKDLVVKDDLQATIINFREFKESSYDNFFYRIINFDHPHYSSNKISSKIKVRRVFSSDLVDISYTSADPGICKGTLEVLTEVFIEEYTGIKVNQSDAVVRYFEGQINLADDKLNNAENELLQFNRRNNIINYYEQTKHIAAEREHFEMRYLEIKLANAGAESVIAALEAKMSVREKQRVTNKSISQLRQNLGEVNLKISLKSFQETTDSIGEAALVAEIGDLRARAYELEQELKSAVLEQYYIDNTTQGISTKSIMDDWIDKVVELEESRAHIVVAEMQEKQFQKLYENYAPLGATMKRLERKINVAEREYLSLLHSLGVAKLNQQSVMNSNLKIVAEPLFPIMAQPSKRKFLIVVAFMIGFIIPAFVVIVLEFLDQNLKTAPRAEAAIGLPVAAIFPKLVRMNKKLDVEFIKGRGLDVIARRLILNTENGKQKERPDTNLLFSAIDQEGKTTIATLLLEKLANTGYKVLFLTYNEIESLEGVDTRVYKIDKSFHRTEEIEDLQADLEDLELDAYDYIFVEIPGVVQHSYPINLFKNTDHSFLVTRANRAWTKSDSHALKDIIELTDKKKPQVLLNGVEMLEMETVIGDLPKRRSAFRRIFKNIIRLQFFNRNKLGKKRAV